MARGLNKCMFIGNLGADPKWEPDKGQGRCAFSIAVNETWKDRQTGEDKERTEWVHIVVWGKLAESCAKYLAKGRTVYVEGKLQTRKFEGRDGEQKTSLEVNAHEVLFLGGGEPGQQLPRAGGGYQAPPDVPEDDLPF